MEEDEKCDLSKEDNPILHVLVVGFHHKKGCIVDYAYPPLLPDGQGHSPELPSQWKHLPSLALPDGSHNYESDTSYFHLPDLHNPRKTIFGISCYRQIDASKVKNPTADVTRTSVQKAVCVLSRLPLFGHIQVKMALITEAFFAEGDFTRLDLIHSTYDNLKSCLTDELIRPHQLYYGLSARKLVQTLGQRTLVLFKLFLLERKVLFFQSPVLDLSTWILTVLSLHPGMLENGLDEAACSVPLDTPPQSLSPEPQENVAAKTPLVNSKSANSIRGQLDEAVEADEVENELEKRSPSLDKSFSVANSISDTEVGLPLKVFGRGNLCHPYLSLSYLDTLSQPCIRGYIIGATNALFKQKQGLAEVLVDVEKDKVDILDPELKKALHLSTEDLRFIDFISKHVSEDSEFDGIIYEGGDEWIRSQFRLYVLCLLRATLNAQNGGDENPQPINELNRFNHHFIEAWKKTLNYKFWKEHINNESTDLESFILLPPLHPCSGQQLSISDMKLHLSNSITNTDGGKRVSQAFANTGRAVAGGLNTASRAFSSWMTSFKTNAKDDEEHQEDQTNPENIES